MIHVTIFDDNASRRDGLRLMIDSTDGMECAGAFPDCREVVKHIETSKPNVVLMDIDMPHVDGIEGVRLIRETNNTVKILMQTVFEDNDKIFAAILAGADGYLLKQTAPTKLIEGIVEVTQGGAPMTPAVAKKVLTLCANKGPLAKPTNFDLTSREKDILKQLVEGYSYKMISEQCNISTGTVNTHMRHIYEKLHVKSATGAVSLAIREGLV